MQRTSRPRHRPTCPAIIRASHAGALANSTTMQEPCTSTADCSSAVTDSRPRRGPHRGRVSILTLPPQTRMGWIRKCATYSVNGSSRAAGRRRASNGSHRLLLVVCECEHGSLPASLGLRAAVFVALKVSRPVSSISIHMVDPHIAKPSSYIKQPAGSYLPLHSSPSAPALIGRQPPLPMPSGTRTPGNAGCMSNGWIRSPRDALRLGINGRPYELSCSLMAARVPPMSSTPR